MTKKQAIQLFQERKVRTIWDDKEEKWYFSIIDVCDVLTDSKDATAYWRKLKQRLKAEGNETVTNCYQLKMKASEGKMRLTDVADTDNTSSNENFSNDKLSFIELSNNKIKDKCVDRVARHLGKPLVRHSNSIYMTEDKSVGFYFAVSKAYKQPLFERYWFGYRKKFELSDCHDCFYVFGCKNDKTLIILPQSEIDKHLSEMNVSIDSDSGEAKHWHIVFTINQDRNVKWSLSKQEMHEIDVTDYLLK